MFFTHDYLYFSARSNRYLREQESEQASASLGTMPLCRPVSSYEYLPQLAQKEHRASLLEPTTLSSAVVAPLPTLHVRAHTVARSQPHRV
ncbi:hypothetical protein A1Q2_03800 [Trichosporon asahii var. asahii CBS 8904]|uniref:Uncharacterized protein n=1 Tax=Trichosporon asahii var. asahii (strain CBS 8904) TaxID=1220162 RepID=K1VD41_TRIAC|nr:hypothetical protein A1Q2_03800 [Trichosporon asahii var. asahii CBS 8904]